MQMAIKIKSLDGDVMFISQSQSICLSIKNFPKCLPNCIYFINGCNNYIPNLVHELGIFNLENKRFRKHYIQGSYTRGFTSPISIIPTICSKTFND